MSHIGKSKGTDGPSVSLGDIAKARMGKTILSKELTDKGVPVYSAGRLNEPWGYISSSELLFGDETIVISARGNIGFPRVPRTTPFVSTQTTIAISLKDRRHVPYLCYQLETVNWSGMTSQTTIPMVTVRQVEGIEVSLPPLDEQYRTVAEIEKQFTRLDAGVAALQRVQANLKRYRAAILKAACEGRLVPTEAELAKDGNRPKSYESGEALLARILTGRRKQWQGRGAYKEPAPIDPSGLPQLPMGWTWATLDQIGQEGRPIIYGIIKPGPHTPNGVPYVRVTEMKDGRIDIPNLRRASHERAAKFARATLSTGDVLISKDGTIGRVAVVPPELEGGNITQHVMRAPIHTSMLRDFVVWAIRSDRCQHWLTGETRGVALRGVNVEDFRRLPIPIPPPAEQLRIVSEVERRLSVVDELETMVSANLQRAARLRQSILQKAFTGDLVQS